ncbi:MAG: c-type cytochrome [Thermoanaerobaculia bacterium]
MRLERLLVVALLFLAGAACSSKEEKAARMTGGDPGLGKLAIRQYGCSACHTIPGVEGAEGLVGPPLDRIGSRVYLAGRLSNTPENLMRWIRDPQTVEPGTAMPDMHVTEQDGRDIAAYLYTLQ